MRTSNYQRANAHRISIVNRIINDLRTQDKPSSASLLSDDVGECTFSVNDLQYHRNYQADRVAKGEAHLKSLDVDALNIARQIGRVNLQISRENGHVSKAVIGHRDVLMSDERFINRKRDDDRVELAAIAKFVVIVNDELSYRASHTAPVAPVVSIIEAEMPKRVSNRKLSASLKKTVREPRCETTLKSFDELENTLIAMMSNERTSIAA